MADLRPVPTREHAAGMLKAIVASHTCTEACTAVIHLGPYSAPTQLRCPWKVIDLNSESDRRIVASVYAAEARAAMGGA